MVVRVIPVDDFDLVIFGATGDLARRKILPGLYRRFQAGQMPADSRIRGAARGDLSDQDFRKLVAEAIAGDAERFDTFARIRHRAFPGGRLLRTPALVAGMAYYRLKDLL